MHWQRRMTRLTATYTTKILRSDDLFNKYPYLPPAKKNKFSAWAPRIGDVLRHCTIKAANNFGSYQFCWETETRRQAGPVPTSSNSRCIWVLSIWSVASRFVRLPSDTRIWVLKGHTTHINVNISALTSIFFLKCFVQSKYYRDMSRFDQINLPADIMGHRSSVQNSVIVPYNMLIYKKESKASRSRYLLIRMFIFVQRDYQECRLWHFKSL